MNTQTAGVSVKDLKSFAGKLWEEQDIDDPGQVIYNLLSMIDKLPDESTPALTIQQALEVWDDAFDSGYGTSICDREERKSDYPDKRTYFLEKFGIDIKNIIK